MIVRYIENNRNKVPFYLLIIVSVLSGILGGVLTTVYFHFYMPENIIEETLIEEKIEKTYSVEEVARLAMPSVVGITTINLEAGVVLGTINRNEGIGTGVIVHEDGYILTNSHVLGNGDSVEIQVILNTGEKHYAQVLWFDEVIDLAVIKIEAINLEVAKFADSDKVTVGETVVAIGNPLGLSFDRTVTAGIVSGLDRTVILTDLGEIDELIQTDASINPGNSGGPLLNNRSEVIGINTVKIQTGEGLGFAIPMNNAKAIIQELIETGSFEKVKIGIRSLDVEKYREFYDSRVEDVDGVYIVEVLEDSSANKAGLMKGDILVGIDNIKITSTRDLNRKLYKFRPGDIIFLEIIRDTERKQIQIMFE